MHLTLLAHMLRLSFRSSESADPELLVSVLSHFNGQHHAEMRAMMGMCRNFAAYAALSEFLRNCCGAYFRLFPAVGVFRGGLAVLHMMKIVLEVTTQLHVVDAAQFAQISNVLVLAAHSTQTLPLEPQTTQLAQTTKSLTSLDKAPERLIFLGKMSTHTVVRSTAGWQIYPR